MHKIVIPKPGFAQLDYWTAPETFPRPSCYVYVIQAEGDSPIKIGKAVDVRNRMSELQTGNPRPLTLRAVLIGDLRLEFELHSELRPYQMTGEWFSDPAGDRVETFLSGVDALAARMYTAYRTSGIVPDFRDFSPYKERVEATQPTSLDPEQLTRIGRASSARREVPTSEQRRAELERRAKEEFAWIMAGEPS